MNARKSDEPASAWLAPALENAAIWIRDTERVLRVQRLEIDSLRLETAQSRLVIARLRRQVARLKRGVGRK